ncbi:PREDICTED: probable chitinase 2 [Nicrophorus vespilloides]|uniref:Probable chitinase 2 n=1 Tax=Nicrophorus vespilloides TaxID=110193 RepID=A0ABM1M3H5_NICVS|nr:PREDICTED: probable chitinase 2 [Nicrophorus vespilloides]
MSGLLLRLFAGVLVLWQFAEAGDFTGPVHGKVVVCYVGTWAVYRPGRGSFAIENIDPNVCTHLVYSFAGLNVTHDAIRSLDPWQDLKDDYGKGGYSRLVGLKDRYPHLKVTLAIGGWNEGSANYSTLVADPGKRGRFIANAVDFLQKYKFDGLDLDWEFPGKRGGNPQMDKRNFLLFVKELRAAFNKFNLLLTAAFGAGKDTIDIAYDVAGLSYYLDYVHMMCYDYHGSWDKMTGANAPLKSADVLNVEYTIDYMLKLGTPANKLVVGLPLYGRTFLLTDPDSVMGARTRKLGEAAQTVGFRGPFTKENGFMGYNEICLVLKNSSAGYQKHWDEETRTPFAVSEDRVISYDDERSIGEKVKLAMEKGLAGAMVWSMDTDDFQGDCADDPQTNPSRYTNFPLMRSINRAIELTLEEIKRNKENEIPVNEDKKTKTSSAVSLTRDFSAIGLLLLSLVVHF